MKKSPRQLNTKPRSILFVCLGNICRSPAAHGVFNHLLQQTKFAGELKVDSAGTAAYHVGNQPDSRMQETALTRGVDLSDLCARAIAKKDFKNFDLILAMDETNYSDLMQICPKEFSHKIVLFLEFAVKSTLKSVPDPYYGGQAGFEKVMDLVFDANRQLLVQINTFS